QLLHGPAGVDDLDSEVIEQFRVGRWIAAKTEIAGCPDNSEPKMMHPHPIDDHARGEGISGIDDGLRQFEAAAAVLEDFVVFASQAAQEPRRRGRTRVIRIPTDKD